MLTLVKEGYKDITFISHGDRICGLTQDERAFDINKANNINTESLLLVIPLMRLTIY